MQLQKYKGRQRARWGRYLYEKHIPHFSFSKLKIQNENKLWQMIPWLAPGGPKKIFLHVSVRLILILVSN
jgi:hypothetical protein